MRADDQTTARAARARERAGRSGKEGARQAHLRRLQALADASRAFAESPLSLPALLDTIALHVSCAVGDGVTIHLLSEDGEWLDAVAFYHPDDERRAFQQSLLAQERLHAGEGATGHVVATGEPLLAPEVSPDVMRAMLSPRFHALVDRYPASGIMAVPLRVQGRVLGSIGVTRDAPGAPFSTEDQLFLQDLADRAALAVQNARLFSAEQAARLAAEAASHARDEFLSIAAHELRSPLTSLRGFADLLARQVARGTLPSPERIAEAASAISGQARKLTLLVEQLLDVSRLEAGQLALAVRETDLCVVVRDAVAMLARHSAEHEVRVDVPERVIARVDPLRIEQVLANLVGNAMRYSPRGGPVEVTLRTRGAESLAEITVRDYGIGIPLEERERIFDRYYQAHRKGYQGGLGLGLYVCRQIALLHGGSITVDAPAGGGTQFTLTLPLR